MAKKKMICPFSDRMCQNCSLYIGRHYRLCDSGHYRGILENDESCNGRKSFSNSSGKKDLSVPELKYIEELDPFIDLL